MNVKPYHKPLIRWTVFGLILACVASASAQQSLSTNSSNASVDDVDLDMVTLVMPIQISRQALSSGCWIQLFDQREFKGRALTVLGPSEFKAFSKAIGLQSQQTEPDSVVTGPKATLTVFQAPNLQDKSAQFPPSSREPELHKKIGFAGRIESLKIDCPK